MIHIKVLATSKCATRGALSQEMSPNFPCKHNYVNDESASAVITPVKSQKQIRPGYTGERQHIEWILETNI